MTPFEVTTMAHKDPVKAVRIPTDLMARCEALVPAIKATELGQAMRVSTASVVRLAMVRGLDALEDEYGKGE